MRFKNKQGRIISANPSLAKQLMEDDRYTIEPEYVTDSTEDYELEDISRAEIDTEDGESDS